MKYIIALLVFAAHFAFADDTCEREMRADPIFSKIEGPALGNEDVQKLLKGESVGMPGTPVVLVGDNGVGKTHFFHTLRAGMNRDKKPHVTIRMNLVHVIHDFEPYRVESICFSTTNMEINGLIHADKHNVEAALTGVSHELSIERHFNALASLLPADTTMILDLSIHDVVKNGTRVWGIYPPFNHRHVLHRLIELAAKGAERGIRVISAARPELLHPQNLDYQALYDRIQFIDFNFTKKLVTEQIDETYAAVIAEAEALLSRQVRPIDMVRMKWLSEMHRAVEGRDLNLVQAILAYRINPPAQDPKLRQLIISWLIKNAKD